jgi:hypothetical protein
MTKKRDRAEGAFKREQDKGGLTKYEADAKATREKTARLRAMRLAKEAAGPESTPAPPEPKPKRPRPSRQA